MATTGKPKLLNSEPKARLGKKSKAEAQGEGAEASAPPGEKKVSQKLLETIERRKKNRAEGGNKTFGRPPGRRGRRPKNAVEYTPENQEEDGYVMESDYEGIEYDTGIRVKQQRDDNGFSLDFDFDEELNFDA